MVRKRKRSAAETAGDDAAGAATAATAAAPAPKAAKKVPASAANNKPNEQAKPPTIAAAAKKPDEGKATAAAAADAGSRRAIFVSGIPYSATEDDLRGIFSKAGKITRVHMPRYHDSGKPRGYAIVDFATSAQAQKALELHGMVLQNRYLDVALSSSREGPGAAPALKQPSSEPSSVLFIKNVPYDVEDSELEELVAPYGDASAVRVGIDSGTGRTKGFAYVEMAKKADAIKVVEAARAKPFVLRGRALAVDYDHGRVRASYKGRRPASGSDHDA